MKEKIKNPVFMLVAGVVLILSLSFYWYEWRPTQIRKNCYKEAQERATELLVLFSFSEDVEFFYQRCLREKGL